MTARPLILAFTGFFMLAAHAAPDVAPAPADDLPTVIERQVAAREALVGKSGEAATALRNWYNTALDAVKKDALSKGNLDGVLAIDKERERLERDLTAEEKGELPPALQTARTQYDQARANQAAQQKTAYAASLRAYVATLETLEKRLTQKSDIEGAIAARKERAAAAELLLAETSTPPPAAAPDPPAKSPPAGLAPPAMVSRTTPATGGIFNSAAIRVAAEIMARGKAKDVSGDAIAFDAPDGNGRRAGRGVLLKNNLETGKNGTTWNFLYNRSGSAQVLQILHPHGRGQVVIDLHAADVGLETPAAWSSAGWRGGDPKKMKMTQESTAIFPLKDDQPYQILSQLSPSGAYTLLIDGRVVATARVNNTAVSPLQLGDGFKGDNLPMKWAPGYAALLVGPVDKGVNICRDIKFTPQAAESMR